MKMQLFFAERTNIMRKSTIEKRFRQLLNELGYTQKEFSAMTGITEAAICRYLDGTRIPNASSIISIADVTNGSPTWLLGYGNDENVEFM